MSVEFVNNFSVVKGRLLKGMEKNVQNAAIYYEGEVKKTIASGPKTGKIYKVPGTNRTYQASAPGEAPAVMLSNYINSITHNVAKRPDALVGTIGTNQKQGKRLEFGFVGTDSRGRRYNQAPRPHFKKTYQEKRKQIQDKLNERIDV